MTGTIDRPSTHDPQKRAPMAHSALDLPVRDSGTGPARPVQHRTRQMHLLHEALARAHMRDRLSQASLRARRAIALAVMR